ncbi:MAG: hypothetical protein OJF52_003247 [Nitrospira sp.]|nr:MAG: hypothetical protein OJF52_003247 [Nitrospira sp.]
MVWYAECAKRRGITMDLSRRALILLSVLSLLWLVAPAITASLSFASTPIYTYIDDAGIQTFTTEFDSIPEKYRSRLAQREHDASPAPPAVPASPAPPLFLEPPVSSADVRIVTAGGEYRMGDHDTRADAVRLAVEAAKRDALEQVATYLEHVTEVRNMDVTRDDIRSYTAGIVKVLDQTITTRLEDETVVIRADLTAQIDPHEVAQAIAALRENESAKSELTALRAETDHLQQQLDAANQALAAAASPEQVQALSQQREDMLNELQANALVSQAWTNWAYPTPGFSGYPLIGLQGINGLLLQAQRLSPRHRHLPLAQQIITAQQGRVPAAPPGISLPMPRQSLLMPSPHYRHLSSPPPQAVVPGSVGAAPSAPTPRAVPPVTYQFSGPSTLHRFHPSHHAQPNPPVLQAPFSVPHQNSSVSPRHFGGHGHSGGGGRFHGSGGHRGR